MCIRDSPTSALSYATLARADEFGLAVEIAPPLARHRAVTASPGATQSANDDKATCAPSYVAESAYAAARVAVYARVLVLGRRDTRHAALAVGELELDARGGRRDHAGCVHV